MNAPSHNVLFELIESLVRLSRADLLCSDLYLHRADSLLGPLLDEQQYRQLCRESARQQGLAQEVRTWAERGDWSRVRTAAQRAARGRARLAENQRLMALGEAVYGPRVLSADGAALALSRIIPPGADLDRVRTDCVARLRYVLEHDPDAAALYRDRLAKLDTADAERIATVELDLADLRQRILDAASNEEFDHVERLCAAALEATRVDVPFPETGRLGTDALPPDLAAALPDDASRRAEGLGLTALTVPADSTLIEYMKTMASLPATGDGRHGGGAALTAVGGRCDAREVLPLPTSLQDALELLALHPFMTSLGSRYVPAFADETLLIETFPESAPESRTGLLDELGLPRRRGISRLQIEDALRTRGPRICEGLGLDPMHHVVVPVPFDVYVRLGPRFGWGQQRLWTHFDGYQLVRDLHLRALVGGDVQYGGPGDLCSVARDYESEHLVSRFAIVRRRRFAPA